MAVYVATDVIDRGLNRNWKALRQGGHWRDVVRLERISAVKGWIQIQTFCSQIPTPIVKNGITRTDGILGGERAVTDPDSRFEALVVGLNTDILI